MSHNKIASMILVGAVLIGGGAAYAGENQADWTTTLQVKLALLEKLGTDSLHVEVDTDAGALTLQGTVDKRETRELAAMVAATVKGVDSVKNDIMLEASVANPDKTAVVAGEAEAELSDAMLSTRIRIALLDQMGTDGFSIGTETADGVVTLAFESDFGSAKRLQASDLVEAMDGVTKVVSITKA
jgi:osmotically-inducible protein OsmY